MNELTYAAEKIQLVFEPSNLKLLFTGIISVLFFLFGEIHSQALLAILMLMVIDTLFAMVAAYKCGEVITSRRFSRVLFKGIIYFTSISAGYFADQTLPFNIIQATMVAFVGVTEFISIIENMGRMGYRTPKRLLGDLREYRDNK